jgi:molybdopterin molybdotransferase
MARKEKNPMISPDEAIALVRAHTFLLDEETVPLLESAGRFLAKDVVSDVQIPPFDNSAMDGFALSHLLLRDASKEHPVTLPIAGEAKAGAAHAEAPDRSAFRIMTGAMVPLGADTVVPIEETSESNRFVTFDHPAAPGDNIRRAGEDIPQGMTVLRQGDRITSAVMGLLASLNMTHIPVFRKARVGIIATGDEIDEPGATLAEGHIRNSNAYSLYAEVLKYGGEPHYVGIAKDTREEIAQMLTKALEYDIIITSGGISMGEYDFVPEVLREHHVRLIFETVKMKPGKPCIFPRFVYTIRAPRAAFPYGRDKVAKT